MVATITNVDASGVFQIFERLLYSQVEGVKSPLNAGHFMDRDYEAVREFVESRILDFGQARSEYAQKISSGERLPSGYFANSMDAVIRLLAEKNAESVLTAIEESFAEAFVEYERNVRAQARTYRVSLYRDL